MTHSTLRNWTFLAAIVAAGSAHAQTVCDDTIGTHRVYILAADTQVPALMALGVILKQQTPSITLFYTPAGSCANITDLYLNTWVSNAAGGGTFYIPDGYDGTTIPPTCTVPTG